MMKKILCLIDFKGSSDNAMNYAATFAKNSGRGLVLYHAVQIPVLQEAVAATLGNESPSVEFTRESSQQLRAYQKSLSEKFGITCEIMVESDYLNREKEAEKMIDTNNYKLVIMGSDSRESLQQSLLGIHADNLLKHITTPLLVIPEGMEYRAPRQVVYATSYELEDAYVIGLIREVLEGFDPEITVLHISRSDTKISRLLYTSMRNELQDELNDDPRVRYERVVDTEIVSGIHNYTRGTNKDLLVMLSKNYSPFEKIFTREVIQQVNHLVSYPLLVIHAPKTLR